LSKHRAGRRYTAAVSRRFRYRQVDVFTDTPLRGNPLAVFPEADGLSDTEMQAIAREMNLSESAFVLPATDEGRAHGANYRLRIFTPGTELPFAGHPSIGTAWVLATNGRFDLRSPATEVRQELPIGVLPISLAVGKKSGGRPTIGEVTMTQGPIEIIHRVTGDELDELAQALEVRPRDLRWPLADTESRAGRRTMPAVISCGLPFLIVPISSLELLSDIEPGRAIDVSRFADSYGSDTIALVAPGNAGAVADADVHVRVLTDPRLGILEDPATGSAAGPICVFLGLAGRVSGAAYRLVIEQGVEIGRVSRLAAEVDFDPDGRPTEARVTGWVVPIAEGVLTLP
jgi:trans-2,3-dihydro-3-hydroxyanthranilate isomerase